MNKGAKKNVLKQSLATENSSEDHQGHRTDIEPIGLKTWLHIRKDLEAASEHYVHIHIHTHNMQCMYMICMHVLRQ